MNLRKLSNEELEDLEQDIHLMDNEDRHNSLYSLIEVQKEMYRRTTRGEMDEYIDSLPMVKKSLISNLIRYGTYLKTEYQKDDIAAEHSLAEALRYDRNNPIAHYRLGFLAYKKRRYVKAMQYFEKALDYQNRNHESSYTLTPQQLYNANLYLSSSALYIAKEAQENADKVEGDVNKKPISDMDTSPLLAMIAQNEKYFRNHEYTILTRNDSRKCSIEDARANIESNRSSCMILIYDRKLQLFFQEQEAELEVREADMLRILMTRSSAERPASRHEFKGVLPESNRNFEVLPNTYTKYIGRLRATLRDFDIPSDIIVTKGYFGETCYFYDHTIPFIIIQRTDEI